MNTSRALLPNLLFSHYTSHLLVYHVGSASRLHAESNHFPRLPLWPRYHLLMTAPACHTNLASCSVVFTRSQVAFLEHSADQATPALGPPVASQLSACVHPLPSPLQPLLLLFPHPYPSRSAQSSELSSLSYITFFRSCCSIAKLCPTLWTVACQVPFPSLSPRIC